MTCLENEKEPSFSIFMNIHACHAEKGEFIF